MTPKQAMEALQEKGLTRYRIAKELEINHAMPTNYLSERTKTMDERIAQRIKNKFGIVIDKEFTYKV